MTVVRGGLVLFGGVAVRPVPVGCRSTVGVLLVPVPLDPVGAVLRVPVASPEVLGCAPKGRRETVPLLRLVAGLDSRAPLTGAVRESPDVLRD